MAIDFSKIVGMWNGGAYDPTPAPAKVGDRPKDKRCKQCKNEGCVVLSKIEPVTMIKHWTCKLCGKHEEVK